MSDFTQADHTFIAHEHYVNATDYAVVGTPLDVRTMLEGAIYIDHAPIEDAIANDPGIEYLIQVNHDDGCGGEHWRTLIALAADTAASTMETLDDTAASGQKVVPVAATGDLGLGDDVYIMDDGGAAASEWAKVGEIAAGVSFTVLDNLTNAFASGEDVFIAGVHRWVYPLSSFAGYAWVRVVCLNKDATGHNWACAAFAKIATDIE